MLQECHAENIVTRRVSFDVALRTISGEIMLARSASEGMGILCHLLPRLRFGLVCPTDAGKSATSKRVSERLSQWILFFTPALTNASG